MQQTLPLIAAFVFGLAGLRVLTAGNSEIGEWEMWDNAGGVLGVALEGSLLEQMQTAPNEPGVRASL